MLIGLHGKHIYLIRVPPHIPLELEKFDVPRDLPAAPAPSWPPGRGAAGFFSLSYVSIAGFSSTLLAPMDPVGAVVALATSTR